MTRVAQLKRVLRGMAKSLTVHAGLIVAVLGYFQSQEAWLTRVVGAEHVGDVLQGIGLAMVLLRARTRQSLSDKGEST